MQHKADIGDDADHILAVALVQFNRLVVAGRHEHLRSRALTEQLLLLVEGVADGDAVLVQHQFVEQRQVSRIIAHAVLHQHDGAHPFFEDVVRRVHAVLYQLDDRDDEVGGVVPVKEIVDVALVVLLDTVVYLFAEGGEQDDRAVRHQGLGQFGEFEHIQLAYAIHRDDEVEGQFLGCLAFLDDRERLARRLSTGDSRRIAQIQLRVLLRDLHVDTTVLLERKTVVVIAHEQDALHALLH